ncbi:MAG: chromosomal replication initiator protein DnaA [Lachnospiraceae bacterium]|nr:chromosomal replication initiator protein DnaA [Lachnospiraceae bacterium]
MELLRQQWDNIKLAIKDEYELTGIAFNIWVKPLQYLKCENNVVSILVPGGNPEMLDYVKINYTNYFQEAISQALQNKFTVEFTLEEEKSDDINVDDVRSDNDINEANSSSSLNPKYHFENFVVGSNNRMAHSVCLRVAETPGTELNPLFIHGGSGLGKTHLMTAIGHYITENSNLKVLYVTSEDFLNEVIESIRKNVNGSSMSRLREKYRNIDVLLIDDIQFIIGKTATQEEFFNTFNSLVQNEKQIVITSDKHPKHIKELDERMRTRFLNGMIVDIAPPAYETRVAILRKYAENFDFKVSDNIIDYIANHIRSNVRELEGAYKQVYALGQLDGDMTLEKAKDILKDIISPDNPSVVTPSLILKGVSEYYNIDADDITSKKRNAEIVLPRQIFMYLCREMTDTTLQGVAALLDKKDHSTVLHGYNKISKEININTELKESIEAIKNIIKTY